MPHFSTQSVCSTKSALDHPRCSSDPVINVMTIYAFSEIKMPGNFQPAKLDVDSSILDSGLKIVEDPEDQISQLFPSSRRQNSNPINTLLSGGEAEYDTATGRGHH